MQFRLSSDINACGRLKHVKMRFADVGQNHPTARLYAETLPRTAWVDPSVSVDTSAIKNLVDVHRLPEVSSLYGFTRFEAAPTSSDGDIEDIQLAVHGAPISRAADRLLAIEQIGEGLHIDEQVVTRRLQTSDVVNRQASLLRGYVHWRTRSTASRLWGQAPDGPSNGVAKPMVGVGAKGARRTLIAIRTVRDLADQSNGAVGNPKYGVGASFPRSPAKGSSFSKNRPRRPLASALRH